jgi:hypothetical protein
MIVDHVTIHVPFGTLTEESSAAWTVNFFTLLGFEEIEPNDPFEHGWVVRWFRVPRTPRIPFGEPGVQKHPAIHLVESGDGEQDLPALGHFCITSIGQRRFGVLAASSYCVRNSGSGRIWLRHANIRVEVRP